MLLLTYTQKVFYMYQSRLSLPSGSSRKSTQRARQRVLGSQFYPKDFYFILVVDGG